MLRDSLRRHGRGRFETFVAPVPEVSGEGTGCEVETCLDLLLSMKERKKEKEREGKLKCSLCVVERLALLVYDGLEV